MCGIAGLVETGSASELAARAASMAAVLRHRGPDADGAWSDAELGVAFAHRRLSILDLSELGAQPMRSPDGALCLTYNGEIYNHEELRADLEAEGWCFRGHSDTEVLLAAIHSWGLRRALERSNGMFALAVLDRRTRMLRLARDRAGEKPLYYARCGSAFAFASELEALRRHPACPSEVDRRAAALFMRLGYVPAPWSIFAGVRKLEPGTILSYSLRTRSWDVAPYWSAVETCARARAAPVRSDPQEAVDALTRLLDDAVRLRMVADVPVGAFLSGGIDSSLVVALMQRHSSRRVRTFAIGFEDPRLDEARHAAAVARHLGTDHHEMYVTAKDALAVIPSLPALYDEPFADSSQIPTFLVARFARQHVTVALSGDGGDELFAGYSRYAKSLAIDRLPLVARRLAGALAPAAARAARAVDHRLLRSAASKLHTLGSFSDAPDLAAIYDVATAVWRDPVVLGAPAPGDAWRPLPADAAADPLTWLQLTDVLSYLPDDILVKVDRATMAVSLEARVPLLDPRIIQFAWTLPPRLRIRGGAAKWVLREALYRHVPRALVDRPKQGFSVPLDAWLRGDLRAWATDLLSAPALRAAGLLDESIVSARLREHLAGERDWGHLLWNALSLQAWWRENLSPARAVAVTA